MRILPMFPESKVIALVGVLMALAHVRTAVRADEPVTWEPVIEGQLATVSVAKALFEEKDGKSFLAGVRVTNKSDREIGVDLRSRYYFVRINQWGGSDTLEREDP